MPILVFQAFIIATLIGTRLFLPKALMTVTVCWSLFTLVMVFMPWLMAIQLFVIWGAYAMIAPKTE